jgi:hypothetical protein
MRRRAMLSLGQQGQDKVKPCGEEKMQHAAARRHAIGAFHHFLFDDACTKALNLRGSS